MENKNVFIMEHPLIQHKLTILRDERTGSKQFRELVSEIAMLMCYESTRDLPLREIETKTPIATAKTKVLSGRKMAFVPILRAGLGMVEGVLSLIPAAKVGHIGMYRDPRTHKPVDYYCKLPSDLNERDVFGHSIIAFKYLNKILLDLSRFLGNMIIGISNRVFKETFPLCIRELIPIQLFQALTEISY